MEGAQQVSNNNVYIALLVYGIMRQQGRTEFINKYLALVSSRKLMIHYTTEVGKKLNSSCDTAGVIFLFL